MEPDDVRRRAQQRLGILDAMSIVIERRVEFIDVVSRSESADAALMRLQSEWGFTEVQAQAALDLQVRRFAGRERERVASERELLVRQIAHGT